MSKSLLISVASDDRLYFSTLCRESNENLIVCATWVVQQKTRNTIQVLMRVTQLTDDEVSKYFTTGVGVTGIIND